MRKISFILVLFMVLAGCAVIAGCATNSSPPTPTTTLSNVPSMLPSTTSPVIITTTAPAGGGQTVTINLIALNIAFDQASITVPAGAHVVMVFDNQDSGVVHNFALYTDSSATKRLFAGDFITGPKKITYTFDAPTTPGTYFFRCDVHPTMMKGAFIVT